MTYLIFVQAKFGVLMKQPQKGILVHTWRFAQALPSPEEISIAQNLQKTNARFKEAISHSDCKFYADEGGGQKALKKCDRLRQSSFTRYI